MCTLAERELGKLPAGNRGSSLVLTLTAARGQSLHHPLDHPLNFLPK